MYWNNAGKYVSVRVISPLLVISEDQEMYRELITLAPLPDTPAMRQIFAGNPIARN